MRTFEINHKRMVGLSVLVSIKCHNRKYKIGELAFWTHSLQRGRNHTYTFSFTRMPVHSKFAPLLAHYQHTIGFNFGKNSSVLYNTSKI